MNTTSVVAAISRNAGGLQNGVRRLHQCLNDLPGVNVRIVSLLDEYAAEDVREWSPLSVKTFPVVGPRAFGYSPGLKAELLADDGEIMHSQGIWQYPSVAVTAWHKRTRRPYLISPHGMLDPWAVRNSAWKKRIVLALYERSHLEQAACLRALCESEAQAFRAFGLKNPICIIPNGIDPPEMQNAECRMQNPPRAGCVENGRKVLLYLGRIHPKKGLANLLRAWAATLNAQPSPINSWCLAIAGWDQGGHEAELKALASELGIQWADVSGNSETLKAETLKGKANVSRSAFQHVSVLFLGPAFGQEKAACYANCDAFILPSFSEGLPMVVLEAWAYGKPVLMTPECNLPEGFAANAAIRIEQNAEGAGKKLKVETLKAEIDKRRSIEDGLRELFALDDAARLALGANGRKLVSERFTWPKIAADMKAVYEWVLGGGQKPGCVVLKN